MNASRQKRYHVFEFARLAGVTVRALHHYDRLGLLKPMGRSSSGYRLYAAEDFDTLQQIVALRFFGFTLEEIRRSITGTDLSCAREILERKHQQLSRVIQAVREAQELPGSRPGADRQALATILTKMQKRFAVLASSKREFHA